ncbi:hypothetical protein ACEU6E_04095 [Halorutilales archaeon Cl-col2-1]
MEIRGDRRCLECGYEWSYFETNRIRCPDCGSMRSESTSSGQFDTQGSANSGIGFNELVSKTASFEETLSEAEESCRKFVSNYGFIDAGELQPPSPEYVMAAEVTEIANGLLTSRGDVDDEEREYVIDLLRGIESGEPPAPEERPSSLDSYHALAVARLVDEYSKEIRRYARMNETDVPSEIETARDKAKRTQATSGERHDAVDGLRDLREAYEEVTS